MGQSGGLLVDAAGQGFKRHVAALKLPLVVLFEQDGSDEPRDGRFVGEEADDIGAAFTSLFSHSIGLAEWRFGQTACMDTALMAAATIRCI